jgi:hypothetical protein
MITLVPFVGIEFGGIKPAILSEWEPHPSLYSRTCPTDAE